MADASFALFGTYYGEITDLKIEPEKRYHWIEEGTDEEFLRNVLECDELPHLMTCFVGSGYTASGTFIGGAPIWRALQHGRTVYNCDLQLVEKSLLQRLLNRPEMQGCETKSVPQIT